MKQRNKPTKIIQIDQQYIIHLKKKTHITLQSWYMCIYFQRMQLFFVTTQSSFQVFELDVIILLSDFYYSNIFFNNVYFDLLQQCFLNILKYNKFGRFTLYEYEGSKYCRKKNPGQNVFFLL